MRYQVPEGMLNAGWAAHETLRDNQGVNQEQFERCLGAALEWLALNPMVPTIEDVCEFGSPEMRNMPYLEQWQEAAVRWQRRMFLAPKLEVPANIEAAIRGNTFTRQQADQIIAMVNECVRPFCLCIVGGSANGLCPIHGEG